MQLIQKNLHDPQQMPIGDFVTVTVFTRYATSTRYATRYATKMKSSRKVSETEFQFGKKFDGNKQGPGLKRSL